MREDCGHVLVIGAANLDIKGRPEDAIVRGTSVAGRIRSSLGGVARNVAENLARLEVETVLITAVGDDDAGERILGRAAGRGIDISPSLIVEGRRSGAYMALMSPDGTLDVALDDMSLISLLTPAYFEARRTLFADACLVVVDANLTADALTKIVALCAEYDVPLCADPTSTSLAERLTPHLGSLYMTSPNVPEVATLCDCTFDPDNAAEAQGAASQLVALGVDVAVVTLGEFGAVYASVDTRGHVPAIKTQIADATGAGDAMTATIIFGLLEGIPLDECVRLGVTAATLTLQSRDTVHPGLSVDLLYDELVF